MNAPVLVQLDGETDPLEVGASEMADMIDAACFELFHDATFNMTGLITVPDATCLQFCVARYHPSC